MATNTYVALDKVTLGSNQTSVTFSSIPSTYTDLVLVAQPATTVVNQDYRIRFNGDTANNYSATYMEGDGSGAYSNRWSNVPAIYVARGSSTTLGQDVVTVNINNYSNATTFKTAIARFGLATTVSARVSSTVGLWRSTSAITSITVTTVGTLLSGSTFSLYGIASEGASAKATGGIITSDANYFYHTFFSSGTFTPTQSLTADMLVVAGGAGGGVAGVGGGGGGAGGLVGYTSQSLTATNYTVTVGAGGAGAIYNTQRFGYAGANSQFGALTASVGGGGGGGWQGGVGRNGGSGGGGCGNSGTAGSGGSATSGQGNAGGSGTGGSGSSSWIAGGGGGGATAVGSNGTGTGQSGAYVGGNGGAGSSAYSSWGLTAGGGQNVSGTVYYAGGGAGVGLAGTTVTFGTGGNGGGGAGLATAGNGLANSGGGGSADAVAGANPIGGAGGSGIVIVRYAKV